MGRPAPSRPDFRQILRGLRRRCGGAARARENGRRATGHCRQRAIDERSTGCPPLRAPQSPVGHFARKRENWAGRPIPAPALSTLATGQGRDDGRSPRCREMSVGPEARAGETQPAVADRARSPDRPDSGVGSSLRPASKASPKLTSQQPASGAARAIPVWTLRVHHCGQIVHGPAPAGHDGGCCRRHAQGVVHPHQVEPDGTDRHHLNVVPEFLRIRAIPARRSCVTVSARFLLPFAPSYLAAGSRRRQLRRQLPRQRRSACP